MCSSAIVCVVERGNVDEQHSCSLANEYRPYVVVWLGFERGKR